MASIKLGMAFADIRGKLGGNYFAKRKNTIVVACNGSKLTKADSGRGALQTARNRLALVARTWKSLTAEDILVWNNAAALLTWYTKVGIPYTPSGYSFYSQVNSNLSKINIPLLTQPVDAGTDSNVELVEVIIRPLGLIKVDYNGVLDNKSVIVVSASYPNSIGVSSPKGGLKQIATITGGSTFPFDITANYVEVFGVQPIQGMVFFKVEIIGNTSGIQNGSKLTKADSGLV